MLTDHFGRKFSYLRLSVTDVCNFRCSYCLPDGNTTSERQFLTPQEITRLVRAFAAVGTRKIRITGGEPSLRRDLPELIHICKQIDGIQTVALTSNGYKLPQHIDAWVAAGLDALNISIDSLDPRQFHAITGQDKLKTILSGIDKALTLGLSKIKINTVLLRQHNVNQLGAYLDWLKHMPVTLRFIELMQTGDNGEFFSQQHYSGQHIQNQLLVNGWQACSRGTNAGPALEYWHPDYTGRVGLIMPYSKDFCQSCNRLRVSATGNLHLCLFAEHGVTLRDYLQDDDVTPLIAELHRQIKTKAETHQLHTGATGATRHLAMLGG